MTSVSNVEREVKLAVKVGADLPDLPGVVGASVRQPEQNLRADYYDTSDMRLWQRGITLRYRTGEGNPRWTLKLPRPPKAGALVRTEVEWDGEEGRVPDEALDAVSGIVRRQSLHKVAELHTDRIRFALEEGGFAWAELASDVVRVVGGPRDGLVFRQLELEFAGGGSGGKGQAGKVLKALRRAGARPDPHPKLEKVLGSPAKIPELGHKSTAEEVVCRAISAGLGRLLDHECRLRVDGLDAEDDDIHQARVATRRLRSDLGTLKPLLDPVWVDHVREDLRSVGMTLGAVRDSDILSQNLTEAGASDRVVEMVTAQRAPAIETLRQTLNGRSYLDLLDRLHAATDMPPVLDRHRAGRKASRVLPSLVKRRWKKLRRELRKGMPNPSDEQLHQLRNRAKQLRYASELSTPVIGKAAKRTAKTAESLQTVLGEHHDAVAAAEWLVDAGNREQIGPVGDLAALIALQYQREDHFAQQWEPLYNRLAKRRRRAWLYGK